MPLTGATEKNGCWPALADEKKPYYLFYMAARLWNKAPFVRLLAALAAGILVQWYASLPMLPLLLCFGSSLLLLPAYSLLPVKWRYRLTVPNGLLLLLLVASLGGMAARMQDVRNDPLWFGHAPETTPLLVKIEEPLVAKANSYKAVAAVQAVFSGSRQQKATGSLLLYFKKDSVPPGLAYGCRLLVGKTAQPIKNAGNPGSFDYQTYSLFKGITHQVFLTADDYVRLPGVEKNGFKSFVFSCRAWVVATLRKFIRSERERGLAEALLIGYKDDLDKNLVQAYSNTGVVHIIAISGLHLGLIYSLLLFVTAPLKRRRLQGWRLLLIIASLWLFSILAGAGPSVLRSALMFTLMAAGELALRKTNVINTLAFSAFVLLCINPFWLWDVGFQLSYTAVLSIVLFYRAVYNWIAFENRLVDFLWKLTAVTLSAQLLTLPISIYHFHQMPLLFLLTNFIAVPLSSLILMGEILLCALFFLPGIAAVLGSALTALIRFMNNTIENLDRLPFSTWPSLSINLVQAVCLTLFSLAICYWLLEKQRRQATLALASLTLFLVLRGYSFLEAGRQQKLVVYNVPRLPAMDIICGRQYLFLGDPLLLHDGFERNFHLQPSRILHRISPQKTVDQPRQFTLAGKRILRLEEALPFAAAAPKQQIDLLVLSKNPKLYIEQLHEAFSIRQVVMDGSVPPWKAALWKKDCEALKIPCYNVAEEGAFVMNW